MDLEHKWRDQRLVVVGKSTPDTKRNIKAGCGQIANAAQDKASANIAYTKALTYHKPGELPDWDVGVIAAKAIRVGPWEKEELFAYYNIVSKVFNGETLHAWLE